MRSIILFTWTHAHIFSWKFGPGLVLIALVCPCIKVILQDTLEVRKKFAVTRIRTWVTSATTKGTDHYTITAATSDDIEIKILTI